MLLREANTVADAASGASATKKYSLSDKSIRDQTDPNASFFDFLPTAKRRSWAEALVVHIIIRLKYLIDSWFFLKPIFSSELSKYPSMLRPKNIPEIDYLTLFGIRIIWILGSFIKYFKPLLVICIKLRIMHALNWLYLRYLKLLFHIYLLLV